MTSPKKTDMQNNEMVMIESYEVWKERILNEAYEELKKFRKK